jgi:integrase
LFTDRHIKNLKPGPRTKDIREKNGFGIRLKSDGGKVFFYKYESPATGKRRFLTIGTYPTITLAEARIKYGDAFKSVKAGGDPLEAAQQEQAVHKAAPTIKELGEDYIKRYASVYKKSWPEDQRILDKEVYPYWARLKAKDITKGNVIALLDRVVDRGSPQTANSIFKIVRKMFNWAVKKDRLLSSPCGGVDMPAPVNTKDRTLNADEIKTVWSVLDGGVPTLAMTIEVRQALKLILVTAQRPGEVAGLHTGEINGNWWTIPAERAKNGKNHRVYLSPLAQEIIKQTISHIRCIRDIPTDQEYFGPVFPCPHRAKDKAIERHALSKALKRNNLGTKSTILGVKTFTPHDLRRTAATFMAEAGELDEVIDAVLNHTKLGVIKVYNLYRYDKEKQSALESWAQKLTFITGKL